MMSVFSSNDISYCRLIFQRIAPATEKLRNLLSKGRY